MRNFISADVSLFPHIFPDLSLYQLSNYLISPYCSLFPLIFPHLLFQLFCSSVLILCFNTLWDELHFIDGIPNDSEGSDDLVFALLSRIGIENAPKYDLKVDL